VSLPGAARKPTFGFAPIAAAQPNSEASCERTLRSKPFGQNKPGNYIRNERQVNILETEHFGRLGFVEFGALTVGRIVQRHPLDQPFVRGAQKSVIKFGGSAVAIFGELGAWRPCDDILERTPQAWGPLCAWASRSPTASRVRSPRPAGAFGTRRGSGRLLHPGLVGPRCVCLCRRR
jgi:hypothetical protein